MELEERIKKQEANKRLKLAKLRKEYLDEFALNLESGVNNKFTIPPKKVLPRFIGYNVPRPLLERPKSQANKHHPNLPNRQENIDFAFQAIARDKNDNFRALFNLINDPNIRNAKGDTFLTFAILMQRYEIVSFLLANGANPDLRNSLGYTPMNIAIEMQDSGSVSLLTNMGADIKFADYFGVNYLMQAVRVGSLPIVEFFIRRGVDINAIDEIGLTALDIAYRSQKEVIAQYLRNSGAKT